jgi:hypothetical protein
VSAAFLESGAVWEEVRLWNSVILPDDSLLHLLEKPADGAPDGHAAVLIGVGIEAPDLSLLHLISGWIITQEEASSTAAPRFFGMWASQTNGWVGVLLAGSHRLPCIGCV